MESINTKPFPSWIWFENEIGIGFWDAPTPMPRDNKKIFKWDEDQLNWVEVN